MGEQIWLYSNPPHFETEDEIPVADFRGEHASNAITANCWKGGTEKD